MPVPFINKRFNIKKSPSIICPDCDGEGGSCLTCKGTGRLEVVYDAKQTS